MTKEGVESGTIRTVMTLHTLGNVFKVHLKGYSRDLNRKKLVSAFRPKKGLSREPRK
jgi:hypothetical protein